MLFHQFDMMC